MQEKEEEKATQRYESCLDDLYDCLLLDDRSWRTLIRDFCEWLDNPREVETEQQRQQRRVLQSKFDTLYAWMVTQSEIR
jgi:hypothetical protein